MVYYVAFGCNNNICNSKNISFFRFPADAAQCRASCWLATVAVQPPVFTAFFRQLFRHDRNS